MKYWLKHPDTDPWKLDAGCKDVAVPNLDIVGWYDHCNGDMLLYRTLAREGKTEAARKGSRIVIGPWGHVSLGRRRFGKIDFGPETAMDVDAYIVRWLDYWLKGKPNGVDRDRAGEDLRHGRQLLAGRNSNGRWSTPGISSSSRPVSAGPTRPPVTESSSGRSPIRRTPTSMPTIQRTPCRRCSAPARSPMSVIVARWPIAAISSSTRANR